MSIDIEHLSDMYINLDEFLLFHKLVILFNIFYILTHTIAHKCLLSLFQTTFECMPSNEEPYIHVLSKHEYMPVTVRNGRGND